MININFSLESIEYFILILIRIASFMVSAPFFNMSNTPRRVKIGFAACVSVIVYEILPKTVLTYDGMLGYSVIVVKEVTTGLFLGLAANICTYIMQVAGNMIDMHIGLSMATEYDPVTMTQSAVSGNLYNYLVLLLLVVTNMQHYILRAIVDSYQVLPINGQNFNWNHMMTTMVALMSDIFTLAFRMVLPVFACIMILNVILGIMAKVAPQMNMFAIGIQLKILLGFLIMFLTIGLLPYISDFVFSEMKKIMTMMLEGMH